MTWEERIDIINKPLFPPHPRSMQRHFQLLNPLCNFSCTCKLPRWYPQVQRAGRHQGDSVGAFMTGLSWKTSQCSPQGIEILQCSSVPVTTPGEKESSFKEGWDDFFTPEICRQLVLQEKSEMTIKNHLNFVVSLLFYPDLLCLGHK